MAYCVIRECMAKDGFWFVQNKQPPLTCGILLCVIFPMLINERRQSQHRAIILQQGFLAKSEFKSSNTMRDSKLFNIFWNSGQVWLIIKHFDKKSILKVVAQIIDVSVVLWHQIVNTSETRAVGKTAVN